MIRVVSAVIMDTLDQVLVQRRGPSREFANLWETPGGKVNDGEDDVYALRRELREELGITNVEISDPHFLMAAFGPPLMRKPAAIYFYGARTNDVPKALEDQTLLHFSCLDVFQDYELCPSLVLLKAYMKVRLG